MSLKIAWKQNILVTDFYLLKSLLVVFGFGSQAFICGFSRQNINSVCYTLLIPGWSGTKINCIAHVALPNPAYKLHYENRSTKTFRPTDILHL